MKKGTLYFFTGLAGAGKTTIGGLFYRRLKARKNDVILFDGEQMRPVYGSDYGYSTEDRLKSAKMEFRLCKLLTDQGLDVVCCAISMYEEARAWNRANIENYREVYI
ncbi:MAG: adenylyl-sulfate kinase, partial [Oscillospiraceae bacterium]|nr:adenylyl-sulfate kinase [Oscillospiraceae bacterium]